MRNMKSGLYLAAATALSSGLACGTAWADCVAGAGSLSSFVTCDGVGTTGFSTTNSGETIQVNATGTVSTPPSGATSLLTAGANSVVNNFGGDFSNGSENSYGINSGGYSTPAITLGGGSTVTNTSNGNIQGSLNFGNATGTAVNTFNNNYSATGTPTGGLAGSGTIGNLDGDINSIGNTVINNQGTINWSGYDTITQTGAGTVTINNGVVGGYTAAVAMDIGYNNSVMYSSISTVGDTTINNLTGASIFSDTITIGTGGAGTSTINNDGVIDNTITMSDATNVLNNTANGTLTAGGTTVTMNGKTDTINNTGSISGNVAMNGTVANTFNAGTAGGSADFSTMLPGNGTGTLTGASGSNNTLNLYGTSAANTINASVVNFYTINKNDSGTWTLNAQLAADKAQAVDVNAGVFAVNNAGNLNTAGGTTVYLANGTALEFNSTAAGTYSGNIANLGTATSGQVIIGIPGQSEGATTFTGTNSYTGGTTINAATLNANSTGALPNYVSTVAGSGAVAIINGGTLNINASNAMGNLTDGGTGTNTLNIAGSNVLSVAGGNFGASGGVITGSGTLTMNGTGTNGGGTLTLSGNNPSWSGLLQVNNGAVTVASGTPLSAANAVVLDSTATTTGKLNVNANTTIGSLNSLARATNAVVTIGSGDTLTTGGLNTSDAYSGKITGAGQFIKTGTANMTISGTINTGANILISAGALTGSSSSFQSNITDNATLIFDQTVNSLTSGTYSGVISGTGYIIKNNAGTLTLGGANTYTGNTYLNGGTVAIGSAGNINSSSGLYFNGATLETTAGLTLTTPVSLLGAATFQTDGAGNTTTLNGAVIGAGSLTKTGAGTLVLGSDSNTYSGGTTVSAGTLQGDAGLGIQGNVVNNGAVKFTGVEDTYRGNMSGTGTVEITAGSIVGFQAGTNTYSGTTTIDAGSGLYAFSTTSLSPNSVVIDNAPVGTVSGDNAGLTVEANSTVASLAGAGAVQLYGATLTVGDTGNNTYSGTLTSPFGSDNLAVVHTSGSSWTFAGTGTGLNNFSVGTGATVYLTGSLSTQTTSVASGATLYVDGTLNSPAVAAPVLPVVHGLVGVQALGSVSGSVTIATGGLLKGGVGTTPGVIVGSLANNGTVQPGHSPGILNVVGSYAQGTAGTFLVNVNATSAAPVAGTTFGQMNVSGTPGTAALAGTLSVIQNGGLYKAGTVYQIITTTGGITGNFSTITGNIISPFVTLSNVAAQGGGVQGNNYDLIVVRSAYNTVATNPNQVSVANGLQGLVADPTAAATVVQLDNMTAAQAQSLFNQASPEPYGAYATALQDQADLFTRQIAYRIDNTAMGAAKGLWINGYGQWGTGKTSSYTYANNYQTTGFAAGYDMSQQALSFGLAAGYSEDSVTFQQGNSSGKSKSWQIGAYGAYNAGAFNVDGQIAYINGDISATKSVNAGAGTTLISGIAGASTKGHVFKGVATLGYNLGDKSFSFRPYVGVDFLSGHVNGFSEVGLGTLDLTVANISANRTDLSAGFKFAAAMGMVKPYVNAAYLYNVGSDGRTVSAYFNNNPASAFSVAALDSGRSQLDVDAGLSLTVGKGATVFAGYEGTFRNDINSSGVHGGLRVGF